MLNRNKFKDILTEWHNFINNNLLLEISRNEVIEVIGEDDYNALVKSNKKASQDQNFLQVVINTYKSNQNHSIEDILGSYQNYTRFIVPKWNQGDTADIDVPGGYRDSLTPGTTTYDDMIKFFDAKNSMNLKSKAYINCLKQGPVNPDFEVIINDSDWIICYPKTIRGSISLARSFWNGSELEYDKSVSGGVGRMIGKMNWCTSIVPSPNRPSGNMFLNYHRRLNLHMYYCVKKSMNIEDLDRKLCISFKKEKGKVSLMKGSSSVNGNNTAASEEEFRKYIGERFDTLFKDVEKSERLEIDEKAYYESINLEQYKTLRAANEDNLEDFSEELRGLLAYSRDRKEILLLSVKEDNINIKRILAEDGNFIEADPTGETIKQLAQDEDLEIRSAIAYRKDLLEQDPTGSLIKQLAQDPSDSVRNEIAYRKDLLEVDPSGEIIRKLAQDPGGGIGFAICKNYDFSKIDPSGKLIRKLFKKNKNLRQNIIEYQNLLQIDPSGEIINKLLKDEKSRKHIAANKNLLKMDPSGELIRKLATDKEEYIRSAIASREDLLEADPSGEIIRQLTKDESYVVRGYIARNKDLLVIDPSGEIIRKLVNDEHDFVRRNTANRKDLLQIDPSGEIIRKLAQDPKDRVRIAINRTYDLSKLQINTNESLLRNYIKYLL
jgi:hypothetical protein